MLVKSIFGCTSLEGRLAGRQWLTDNVATNARNESGQSQKAPGDLVPYYLGGLSQIPMVSANVPEVAISIPMANGLDRSSCTRNISF